MISAEKPLSNDVQVGLFYHEVVASGCQIFGAINKKGGDPSTINPLAGASPPSDKEEKIGLSVVVPKPFQLYSGSVAALWAPEVMGQMFPYFEEVTVNPPSTARCSIYPLAWLHQYWKME